jgi:O-antigen/teichoic acid export membrane protein
LNGSSTSICLILLGIAYAVGHSSRELSLVLFAAAALTTLVISSLRWQAQTGARWSSAPLSDEIYSVARASHPSVIFQLSTQYAAQFTVAAMLSTAQVAEFTTALRVALLIAFVLMEANLMIAGQLADLHAKKDIEGINQLTKQTSQLLLAFSIPLLFIIWWGARNVMGLFGAAYESSAIILQILAIGQFINVLTGPTSMILTMCGGEFDQRRVLFITFIVSTLAAIVLTHLYGLMGAAIATALGVSSQNLMAAYYVHKRLGFNVLNPFRTIK